MDNLVLLAFSFALGTALRASGRMPENTPAVLNGFIVHVSLPAMTLYYLHKLQPSWAPLAMMAAFAPLASGNELTYSLIVFEAAMAPMIGATIVATEHKLNPPLVTLMAGVGIPLSFLTLPVWHAVLTA